MKNRVANMKHFIELPGWLPGLLLVVVLAFIVLDQGDGSCGYLLEYSINSA
jgi:hypothetical protein